jgi:hypothetical protein
MNYIKVNNTYMYVYFNFIYTVRCFPVPPGYEYLRFKTTGLSTLSVTEAWEQFWNPEERERLPFEAVPRRLVNIYAQVKCRQIL